MQTVSDEFLRALRGPIEPIFQVNAWRQGKLIAQDLPLGGGSVSMSNDSATRGKLNLIITDSNGKWRPTADGPLSPYGSELNVQVGLILTQGRKEMFSLGWFVIDRAETEEEWKTYTRPDEPGVEYQVSRGQITTIDAPDRTRLVARNRFLTRTSPTSSSVMTEIANLLRGIVPFKVPASIPTQSIPVDLTYDNDRLSAVQALAESVDATTAMTPAGSLTLVPNSPTSGSVWYIPIGYHGALIKMQRSLDANEAYNAVIARGTTPDGVPLQSKIATVTSGPLAWDGPYGRVPLFYESSFLTTQSQVDQAAVTRLAKIVSRNQQLIDVTCVWNPAIELDDLVTIEAPLGDLQGRVQAINWPLQPGTMTLRLAVDQMQLEQVS